MRSLGHVRRRPAAMGRARHHQRRAQPRVAELSEPLTDVTALQPSWRALEAEADPSFFLTWAWIGTLLATLGARPSSSGRRWAATPSGLGVLVPHRAREHGLVPVQLLALNATGDPARDVVTIEYNGLLAHPRARAARHPSAADPSRRPATRRRPRWDALEIVGAPTPSSRCSTAPPPPPRHRRDRLGARRPRRGPASASALCRDLRLEHRRGILPRLPPLYDERGGLRLDAARDIDEALAYFAAAGPLHRKRAGRRAASPAPSPRPTMSPSTSG